MLKKSLKLIVISMVCLLIACSEENYITQNTPDDTGIFSGQVVALSGAITVSAWLAVEVASTEADSAGYFAIRDLLPGVYEIRIVSTTGQSLRLSNKVVNAGIVTNLGELHLSNLVWPIYHITPSHGSTISSQYSNISVTSSKKINLASLQTAATISPPINGIWNAWITQDSSFLYSYAKNSDYVLGQEYTVSISTELEFDDGERLSQEIVTVFSMESFDIRYQSWNAYNYQSLKTDFQGTLTSIYFNGTVDVASADLAVSISPTINFSTLLTSDLKALRIILEGGLSSGTEYTIKIGTELLNLKGDPIQSEKTYSFATSPFAISFTSLIANSGSVDPLTKSNLVHIKFTQNVSQASIDSHLTVVPQKGIDISLNSYKDAIIIRRLDSSLRPGQTYQVTLASGVRAEDGAVLDTAIGLEFTVEPLKVVDFGFSNYYSPFYTILDAEDADSKKLRIEFNTYVNEASLDTAIIFDFSIEGNWIFGSSYSREFYWLFTSSPVEYAPDTRYEITVLGSVGLVDGVALGNDTTLVFQTNPLAIELVSPPHGSVNVSIATNIRIDFNATMNKAATEASFSLLNWDGTLIPGIFSWSNGNNMWFNPDAYLIRGNAYKVIVTTSAKSASGHFLPEQIESVFSVSP